MWRGTREEFERWKQRKTVRRWEEQQWRNQLAERAPTAPPVTSVRVIVRCKCGHQAELSIKFRGVQHQPLRCSKCRNADPAIERLDIGPRHARYHPGAATGPRI